MSLLRCRVLMILKAAVKNWSADSSGSSGSEDASVSCSRVVLSAGCAMCTVAIGMHSAWSCAGAECVPSRAPATLAANPRVLVSRVASLHSLPCARTSRSSWQRCDGADERRRHQLVILHAHLDGWHNTETHRSGSSTVAAQCDGGGVSETTQRTAASGCGEASGPAALLTPANARQHILPCISAVLVRTVPRRTCRRACVRSRPVAVAVSRCPVCLTHP